MFTSQKIRWILIDFYFDKLSTHANAFDGMHENARENELVINFLPVLFYFSTKMFRMQKHVRQGFKC